jgi:hypothetical protein
MAVLRAFWAIGMALLIGVCLLSAAACDPDPRFDSGCPSGTIGCPCLPDGTCEENQGQCLEDTCVAAVVDEPVPPQDARGGAGGASD